MQRVGRPEVEDRRLPRLVDLSKLLLEIVLREILRLIETVETVARPHSGMATRFSPRLRAYLRISYHGRREVIRDRGVGEHLPAHGFSRSGEVSEQLLIVASRRAAQ